MSLTPSSPRAVLFDLDGTLIDSLPDLVAAVNRMLAEWDRPALSAEAVKALVGGGAAILVERAFMTTGGPVTVEVGELLRRFMADYEPRSAESTRPWPAVIETLTRLKEAGLLLAVCTNKPSGATAVVLSKLGLAPFFDVVVGADDTPVLKPDPTHIHVILDRLGVTAAQAVMVGDSFNDIAAARAAGVPTVAVSFGYAHGPVAELGADRIIDDYRELPSVLGLDLPPPELVGMVSSFAREMAADRTRLRELLHDSNRAALLDHVHAMRGKCSMFGESSLADRLGQLEQDVLEATTNELDQLVAPIFERLEWLVPETP
ncbi:phosphoglycolate phosphatase [Magnetospirillum molischianum]|uniref:Phosphoglycolate phosphatase n=1 Tax=Magnetospirillum molischianum DSM 120 TaxID=1150626 RepID=H8FVI7_MAGML|nr:phosphoglycolate phosphatase [Magnetospirillum molischianum]CCG42375.1 Phosphoglycolate phosphatase (modular protein) [Magnetospirillum molischianum DSM 120]